MKSFLNIIVVSLVVWTSEGLPTEGKDGWGSGWGSGTQVGNVVQYGQTVAGSGIAASTTATDQTSLDILASDTSISTAAVGGQTFVDQDFDSVVYPTNVDTPSASLTNYAPYAGSYGSVTSAGGVSLDHAAVGSIANNPSATSASSTGTILQSAFGSITEGANLVGGGGWKAADPAKVGTGWGTGWTSGWGPSDNNGSVVTAGEVTYVENQSQLVSSSDNVSVTAVGDGINTLTLYAPQEHSITQYSSVENDGVELSTPTGAIGHYGEYIEEESYPSLVSAATASGVDSVTLTQQPNITVSTSAGTVLISDFATIANGTNLVNNGWGWGNSGSGWKKPEVA